MKKTLTLLTLVALTGCSHTVIDRNADGIKARNTRWFWASEGIEIEYPTTNGVAKAKIKKSNAAADAIDSAAAKLDKLIEKLPGQ